MNATHIDSQASLQVSAQDDVKDSPILVEELSIDELAVREEYAACATITK